MKLPRILHQRFSILKEKAPVEHHEQESTGQTGAAGGLSVFFTILCIVDLFGVFPIVALPSAVIACGLYGIPLMLLVVGLQLYTAVLLGRCWVLARALAPHIGQKNRYPYAAVAELACGARTRRLVTFLLDATVFGAGIPNLLVASQSLQLFGSKMSAGAVDVSFCLWLLLIGLLLCPVTWLGSPKDMKSLAAVSVCVVCAAAACTWACVLLDAQTPPPRPARRLLAYRPAAQDFLAAYGIIAFQFDIHPVLLTIQVDMKDSSKINMAVFGGFLVTGAMFAVTSALAATRYGLDVQSNILQGIPASIPLYVVVLLVTLQLCLSSAVGNSALFQHIEDILQIPREFTFKRCITRSTIVALAVFLGESVPRFDLVMGLVGSTLTGPLMFIFPPLFFIKLSRMKSSPQYKDAQADTHLTDGLSLNAAASEANTPKQNGGPLTQDGVTQLSKLLTISEKQCNNYDTFKSANTENIVKDSDSLRLGMMDVALACAVMLFGVTATVAATYSSWSDAINYASFTTPCLLNATAAANSYFRS